MPIDWSAMSVWSHSYWRQGNETFNTVGAKSGIEFAEGKIPYALRGKSWQPGQLHPNLSWTHYRTLLRVEKTEARAFYEIEAIRNNWSTRELER